MYLVDLKVCKKLQTFSEIGYWYHPGEMEARKCCTVIQESRQKRALELQIRLAAPSLREDTGTRRVR